MDRETVKLVLEAFVEAVPFLLFLVPAIVTIGWVASILIMSVPAN